MHQITGFIKAFNESCTESTGMIHNCIDSSMCTIPVEWKKKIFIEDIFVVKIFF
jgi:hypothetical protein